MKRIFCAGAALLAAVSTQASAATILTFEGQANAIYSSPITRSGFVIGNVAGDEQHFHEVDSTVGGLASNGTGVLVNDRDTRIFVEQVGNGAFSLTSFDIAASFGNSPGLNFTLTGYLSGGAVGTITGSLGQFATFAGFNNVDRLVFDGTGGGGGFELDNIVLDSVVTSSGVPETATWAMMIIGFAMVGGAMRRRQRQDVRYSFA